MTWPAWTNSQQQQYRTQPNHTQHKMCSNTGANPQQSQIIFQITVIDFFLPWLQGQHGNRMALVSKQPQSHSPSPHLKAGAASALNPSDPKTYHVSVLRRMLQHKHSLNACTSQARIEVHMDFSLLQNNTALQSSKNEDQKWGNTYARQNSSRGMTFLSSLSRLRVFSGNKTWHIWISKSSSYLK